ncbi:hypothetical protein [Tumebacillus lipolyticus]|uniref:Transposase n=1 Tax=Tumebacillus lipolyticus TaxID=1280370 RepID=A0ABW5A2H8_9BACL
MRLLLIAGIILLPLVLFALRNARIARLFDLLAAVAALLFLITSGLSVLEIKQMNTEFTTHIHQIFNNLIFLSAAGYIGIYSVYRLLGCTFPARQENEPSR